MAKSQVINRISVGSFGNSVNSVGGLVSVGFIVRGTSAALGSEDKGDESALESLSSVVEGMVAVCCGEFEVVGA
jgi:hypothetical protein